MPEPSTFKRFVEVGRVVLLKSGPSAGRVAVIVEIIDHRRAIVDGPTTGVPRQSFPYRHMVLTPLKTTIPRACSTGIVRKALDKDGTIAKWEKTSWAQKLESVKARSKLNDFERFSVMLQKKSRRDRVRKHVKAAKASA